MPKIIIDVTETVAHQIKLELQLDNMNDLVAELTDQDCCEIAGDMCSSQTVTDREFKLDGYRIIYD